MLADRFQRRVRELLHELVQRRQKPTVEGCRASASMATRDDVPFFPTLPLEEVNPTRCDREPLCDLSHRTVLDITSRKDPLP